MRKLRVIVLPKKHGDIKKIDTFKPYVYGEYNSFKESQIALNQLKAQGKLGVIMA